MSHFLTSVDPCTFYPTQVNRTASDPHDAETLSAAFPTGDPGNSIAIFQWLFRKGWPSGLSGREDKPQSSKRYWQIERGLPSVVAPLVLPQRLCL